MLSIHKQAPQLKIPKWPPTALRVAHFMLRGVDWLNLRGKNWLQGG